MYINLVTILAAAAALPFAAKHVSAQVTATFPNGVTNPPAPTLAAVGSIVNQTSDSRLIILNSVDDFCVYAPPEPGPQNTIGNTEPFVVAYCTKPRNNARLIPDGVITAAHFVRTPLYVQVQGFWDGTRVNIPDGDYGGELDPHGAENLGNPIGGNVTSDVSGMDVFYQEWMSFVSFDQFCLRVCIAENENITAALQCEHELDVMGCQFVMPGDYTPNSFTSCEGEPAAGPGLYPQANGSTTTFRQRYTGTYTIPDQTTGTFTVGNLETPSAPAFIPATSNCVTYPTISNGVNTADFVVVSQNALASGTSAPMTTTMSGSSSAASTTSSTSGASTGSSGSSSAASGATSRSGTSSTAASATAPAATSAGAASGATRGVESGFGFVAGSMVVLGLAMVSGVLAVAL